MKLFNDLHYLTMSCIILPPYHFVPWKLFNDLHYLPMSLIIFPPGFILPTYHFAPPLPLDIFECTLFTYVLHHFCPLEIVS